jgi:hypothetical protein
MRKLIIFIGIIGILALSVQSWAAETPLYGCAQGKDGEVRAVNAPGDCLPSETVVALNRTDPENKPSQKTPQGSQEKTKKYPSVPFGTMFGGDRGFITRPGW